MLRLFFIVECDVARFLCAVRVFEVQASFPSHTFVPNFVSFAASVAELAHGEKSHTQSINQLPSLFDVPGTDACASKQSGNGIGNYEWSPTSTSGGLKTIEQEKNRNSQ